jgi:hypothetical protein
MWVLSLIAFVQIEPAAAQAQLHAASGAGED